MQLSFWRIRSAEVESCAAEPAGSWRVRGVSRGSQRRKSELERVLELFGRRRLKNLKCETFISDGVGSAAARGAGGLEPAGGFFGKSDFFFISFLNFQILLASEILNSNACNFV